MATEKSSSPKRLIYSHTLELEQLTDLTEYSHRTFGDDVTAWPWYYTTEGLDPYTMQRSDLITVYWKDKDSGLLFILKHGVEWHIQ